MPSEISLSISTFRLDDGYLNLEVRPLKVNECYKPQLILATLPITGLLKHTETEINPQSAYPLNGCS